MRFKKIIVIMLLIITTFFSIKFIFKQYIFPYKYKEYVQKYSKEYNLDPLFVLAIIKCESDFDPWAVSKKDAKGLMQIMDSTAEWAAKEIGINNFNANMLVNPEINIRIGCWYLDNLRKEFNKEDLIIAAYNGGSGNVNKWLSDSNFSHDGQNLHYIPFKETKKYVDKVNTTYNIYKYLYL